MTNMATGMDKKTRTNLRVKYRDYKRDKIRDNNKFDYIAVCKIFLLLFSDIYIANAIGGI